MDKKNYLKLQQGGGAIYSIDFDYLDNKSSNTRRIIDIDENDNIDVIYDKIMKSFNITLQPTQEIKWTINFSRVMEVSPVIIRDMHMFVNNNAGSSRVMIISLDFKQYSHNNFINCLNEQKSILQKYITQYNNYMLVASYLGLNDDEKKIKIFNCAKGVFATPNDVSQMAVNILFGMTKLNTRQESLNSFFMDTIFDFNTKLEKCVTELLNITDNKQLEQICKIVINTNPLLNKIIYDSITARKQTTTRSRLGELQTNNTNNNESTMILQKYNTVNKLLNKHNLPEINIENFNNMCIVLLDLLNKIY